jgi:hypothetical protein
MADEDFDRAQHRLRQELAARDMAAAYPLDFDEAAEVIAHTIGADIRRAKWLGDQPPEQVDRDMMANYNRCVIAEAARTTSPGRINWLAVGLWGFLALTVVYYTVQGIRWAINR